jgi:hypothetical protein
MSPSTTPSSSSRSSSSSPGEPDWLRDYSVTKRQKEAEARRAALVERRASVKARLDEARRTGIKAATTDKRRQHGEVWS